MSNTVRSFGLIGLLKEPILDEIAREEMGDKLYDAKSGLQISYDGKLVILDKLRHAHYSEREDIYTFSVGSELTTPVMELVAEVEKFSLQVDPIKILPFNCIWYNGSDAPFRMMTGEQFLNKCTEMPNGT